MSETEEKNIQLGANTNTLKTKINSAKFKLDDGSLTPEKTKKTYHEQRLSQSKWAFRLSFFGSIVGFIVIVSSLRESIHTGNEQWAGIASGTVIEAVSALFYNLSNKANEKITEFFLELTKDSNITKSIILSDQIGNDAVRDELKVKLSLHLAGIDEDKICKNTNEVCNKNDT